jgi:hypothetical protein
VGRLSTLGTTRHDSSRRSEKKGTSAITFGNACKVSPRHGTANAKLSRSRVGFHFEPSCIMHHRRPALSPLSTSHWFDQSSLAND